MRTGVYLPSTKPKCPKCGEISVNDISFNWIEKPEIGGGTAITGSANYYTRLCKICKSEIYF